MSVPVFIGSTNLALGWSMYRPAEGFYYFLNTNIFEIT